MVFEIQNAGCGIRPLDILSGLQEVPPLAMRHGRVGDALEGVKLVDKAAVEADRAFTESRSGARALEVEIKAIQLFPHLAGYLLAHGAGIFTCERHRR